MKLKKYIKLAALLGVVSIAMLGSVGCGRATKDKISRMERPVVIVACNDEGVILLASDGELLDIPGSYYIAKTMNAQSFQAGEVLIP